MEAVSVQRRLAAILAIDIVGYSRLIEADEAVTLAAIRELRATVIDPLLATHHGRIVKLMGDGLLAEFASVVDAVACAIEAQKQVAAMQMTAPAERRIVFRMGINLGDVVVEGADLLGDGVNVAARLEQLCDPGGVLLSGAAYDHLQGKLGLPIDFAGKRKVKNISRPVRVYRVRLDGRRQSWVFRARRHFGWVAAAAVVALIVAGGAAWWFRAGPASDKPSLVVLPFDNLNDDKQQGYLADGITEDLTTELARMPGLFVVSRNAAFHYKGKDTPPPDIAKELGIRFLLEGSIRRVGDDIRINAQLIDGNSGGHVWAERFDGKWQDVFSLQDKMADNVAIALRLRLVQGQNATQAAGGTDNAAAYELYLQGLEQEYLFQPESLARAAALFQKAVDLDPNFGRAWAERAWVYYNFYGEIAKAVGISDQDWTQKLYDSLREAAKHPSPSYYQITADVLLRGSKFDDATIAIERAIALDPSDPYGYEGMGNILIHVGRAADGKEYLETASRLDPRSNAWRRYLVGLADFDLERFDDAVAELQQTGSGAENYWAQFDGKLALMAAYGQLGRRSDADKLKSELDALVSKDGNYGVTVLLGRDRHPFKNLSDLDRLLDGLRKAGLPELPLGYDGHSKERLSGEQIKTLLFGHQVLGQFVETHARYARTTALDGAVTIKIGDDPQDEGFSHIEEDTICTFRTAAGRYCAAIFRNPDGTFAAKNEYVFVVETGHLDFSIVN